MHPAGLFTHQNILLTGAGGYIGSALAKTLTTHSPNSLVLLDSSEQNLFQLRTTLNPNTAITFLLGNIEDQTLLIEIFTRFNPKIIFHAAAHKHVELLELNPFAAARNNILGTNTLLQTALQYGCQTFILLSTDKAVYPTSIMGATKRIAELLTVSLTQPSCRMNAVRLCNVIGSTGSVIPIMTGQIARGEHVTVTDPEASRYFIPLQTAVDALMTVAACNLSGRIIRPEYGPPVRIMHLAKTLMNGKNLPIDLIGLRAGEKIVEDLIAPAETPEPDLNAMKVLLPQKLSPQDCHRLVERIQQSLASRNLPELLQAIATVVPEYQPSALLTNQVTQ